MDGIRFVKILFQKSLAEGKSPDFRLLSQARNRNPPGSKPTSPNLSVAVANVSEGLEVPL